VLFATNSCILIKEGGVTPHNYKETKIMKVTKTPLLHTIEQTRQLLACGRNTVYNLVSRNELTLIKMGRRSLITDESIRDYVAQKILEAQTRLNLEDAVSLNARRSS